MSFRIALIFVIFSVPELSGFAVLKTGQEFPTLSIDNSKSNYPVIVSLATEPMSRSSGIVRFTEIVAFTRIRAVNAEGVNKWMDPSKGAPVPSMSVQVSAKPYERDVAKDSPFNIKADQELRCLALSMYFEARGEPMVGQRAVGHVVMNRVAHSRFPKSVCEVVRQGGEQRLHRCQFSWWCDGHTDKPKNKTGWKNSVQLATKIYHGESTDPTGGALWYHADYVSPYWQKVFTKGPKIGQHIFYLDSKQTALAV